MHISYTLTYPVQNSRLTRTDIPTRSESKPNTCNGNEKEQNISDLGVDEKTGIPLSYHHISIQRLEKAANEILLVPNVVASPASSTTQPISQDDNKVDREDWIVVDSPRDEPYTCGEEISSQFSLHLGRGSWRFTLFSWDLSIRSEHTHEDERK